MAKEGKMEHPNGKDEKKIIIDEDWKQQAQREKEKLAEQEKAEKEKMPQGKGRRGPLPEGDFAALVSMLVTQALFALGLIQVEGQKDKEPDLELAKYNIDMLETIEKKTKGNLTEEEKNMLENTLSQIRMAYVKLAG
jgi:hypothetical protein